MGMMNDLTSPAFRALLDSEEPLAVLLPVGSVEPHGPHLPLGTDTTISLAACRRAVPALKERGIHALIAPTVPYGVTECAAAFPGAVSISPEALIAYLKAVIEGFLQAGADHICLVNNHLEPAHDRAVRAALSELAPGKGSIACPLTRRWARTLSAEFKSGQCHAGQYETSIVMAETPDLVNEESRKELPDVPVSLSEKLMAGISDFKEMGMHEAYAGSPRSATAEEGEELLSLLVSMITTEVEEALSL